MPLDPISYAKAKQVQRSLNAVRGELLDDFNDSDDWTLATSGAATKQTVTDEVRFPYAIEVQTDTTTPANLDRDASFDARGKFVSFWLKTLDANFSNVIVNLIVGSARNVGVSRFRATAAGPSLTIQNRWQLITVPAAAFAAQGSSPPDDEALADVRAIRISVGPTSGQATKVRIADLRLHENPLPPGICWVFDDGHESVYDQALPILSSRGIKGVIPVVSGQAGTTGYMTVEQLLEAQAAGWGICAHSTDSTQLNTLTGSELRAKLKASYDFLIDNGFDKEEARHLVYPGGAWNEEVVKESLKIFRTCRTIQNFRHETAYVANYGLLRTMYMGTSTDLATAKLVLDAIAARGGVTIATFHKIGSFSESTDVSAADLAELADYASGLGLASYTLNDLYPGDVVPRGLPR